MQSNTHGDPNDTNAEVTATSAISEAPVEDSKYNFPLPAPVLSQIFDILPVESLLLCRSVCSSWNKIVLDAELLDSKSCFVFDGRKDDAVDTTKCSEYMETSDTKNYLWSHLKFRRVVARHCSWVFSYIDLEPDFTANVSTLELLNSTLNWSQILQLLIEFENLEFYMDKQDMYCWDYATFNAGIEEEESIIETASFQQLRNQDKLDNLNRLKKVHIHRSQLVECTTYMKILQLRSECLEELEVNTDQNFAPQRGILFYTHLARVLRKTGDTLRILRCPYKLVCPTYDFRTTDEHRLFREFLTYITDNHWVENVQLPALEHLGIQYGIVPIEGQDLITKLAPFLMNLPKLKSFFCGCIHLETGHERVLEEFLELMAPQNIKIRLGLFMNDTQGVPNILQIQTSIQSISTQSFHDTARELTDLIPRFGIEKFDDLKEFQYFSKNHTFRNFNLEQLIYSFSHLTHLNLVDHNARLETRHSCEALATIEDSDMQLIICKLNSLVSLQLIGNMTFLTDTGLTGCSVEACRRILKAGEFVRAPGDLVGVPISHLQGLRSLVLRGLGIKVTDVSARMGFSDMPYLIKLHIFGCHQITVDARLLLAQRYNVTKGCDLQI